MDAKITQHPQLTSSAHLLGGLCDGVFLFFYQFGYILLR